MIERKVVQQKIKEYMVENYVSTSLTRVGHSHTTLSRSPLGEKITIHASRPGLIVGSKGSNIKKLTKILKAKFKLENPQVEIEEVKEINLDPKLVAESIASSLERFGTSRFKGVGYKSMEYCVKAGAMGIEILISGKIPSSRAKRWRFYMGYLKKCGDISVEGVKCAYDVAKLKTGIVGIQVRIMPPGLLLPDQVSVIKTVEVVELKGDEVVANVTKEAEVEAKETENLKVIKEKVTAKKATEKVTKEKSKKEKVVEKSTEKVTAEAKEQ